MQQSLELRLVGCGLLPPVFDTFFVSATDSETVAKLAVQDFSSSLISFRDKDLPVPSYL